MKRESAQHEAHNEPAGTSTAAQRRAIVLAGKALGFDLDGLRAMTPCGSLRALTYEEASGLLDRLNRRDSERTVWGPPRKTPAEGSPCETAGPDEGLSSPSRRRAGGDVSPPSPAAGPCRAGSSETHSPQGSPTGRDGSRPRRPASRRAGPGVLRIITERQRRTIASYQGRLGYDARAIDDVCRKVTGVRFGALANRRDATKLLAVLGRVLDWRERKDGQAATPREEVAAVSAGRMPAAQGAGEGTGGTGAGRMPAVHRGTQDSGLSTQGSAGDGTGGTGAPDIMDKLVQASRVDYA